MLGFLSRKYASVLNSTIDAVVAGELDGRITVFNPGAEKLFGCTADEALGTPIARFCPEDRLTEQAEMMRRVRDEGTVTDYETERLTSRRPAYSGGCGPGNSHCTDAALVPGSQEHPHRPDPAIDPHAGL